MNKTTLADVAKIAGVSKATVSRVVTDSPLISDATKDKVNKIIKELNYSPNSIARSLSTKNTHVIGIVRGMHRDNSIENYFFAEILTNINNCARDNNYYILYINSSSTESEIEDIKSLINANRVDGLILLTVKEKDKTVKYLQEIEYPFVVIGTPNDKNNCLWVDNDNIKAGYDITKELISRGNKNICFMGGDKRLNVTKYRYIGYKEALKDNNILLYKENILESAFNYDEAYKVFKEFIKNNKNIDAVMTTDDILALGVIKVLEEMGRLDILVSGFNNISVRNYLNYSFLTVDINVGKLGKSACKLLINKLQNIEMEQNFKLINTTIVK